MSWREANGPFQSIEDLLAVSGIGPATLEGLSGLIAP
jgi:DNA uptake protein ComE-like DNA-binding protein